MHRSPRIFATGVLAILCIVGTVPAQAYSAPEVKAEFFQPGEVQLLDGPFQHAMQLDAAYLLTLDSDRLLSWYRKEAGLEPRAEVYGGWESRGIAGHSLGHYLSACARAFKVTGREEFRDRVAYIVEELAKCQQAGGDGYVGAIPDGREVFAQVARGEIRSAGFDLNGSWVPWYNLHKLYAGLIDAYLYCDNQQALEVVEGMADWAIEVTKDLSDRQWQRMLACEHGGMNESLADLYAVTGKEIYLQLAKDFYHEAILDPLAEERDDLAGKHANTQVPKVIGAARIFELTGDDKFGQIAQFFWNTVLENHTYVIGGNSMGEHFGTPGQLSDRLGSNTAESCNTYNMIKLTAKLHSLDPQARYADYMERALWNHILASHNPETGMVCYFVPLAAGSRKEFMGPEAFTCCSGSGMENHVRYGDYIYAASEDALWVNLYISSELDWSVKKVRVRQESQFPEQGATRLRIACDQPTDFTLVLRHPHWAEEGFNVRINNEAQNVDSHPGSLVQLDRQWADGDVVEVTMPMSLRLEAMPDNPDRVAVFRGPVLLAGILKEDLGEQLPPVLVTTEKVPDNWLEQSGDALLRYQTQGVGRPEDLELVPFFSVHDRPYMVYWDLFDESAWQQRQEEYEAEQRRLRELDARTVDFFAIGEMQPERDHNVQGENTSAGEYQGRKLRHAWDGGWFSFDVELPTDAPAELILTYWGGETGNRTFDILLDGEKLLTQTLHQDKPGEFWDKHIPLDENLTRGKTKATLRFQAHPGNYAGGLFGVRVVRQE